MNHDHRLWTWREALLVLAFVAWLLLALLAALAAFACQSKRLPPPEPLPPVLEVPDAGEEDYCARINDSPIEIEQRRVLCGPRSIDRDAGSR